MPTASKLVAALALALTALATASVFAQVHSELQTPKHFYLASGVLGFWVGWSSLGRAPGATYISSIIRGISSIVYLVVVSAVFFAVVEVGSRIEGNFFREPMDLLIFWLTEAVELIGQILHPRIMAALAIGMVIAAVATQWAYRNWR